MTTSNGHDPRRRPRQPVTWPTAFALVGLALAGAVCFVGTIIAWRLG